MRQRDIVRFWLPLFGSWLLLTSEGPLITTVINRLPDPVIMLAAAGIVLSLSVFIESPIINLLATSTAMVTDYQSYRQVRRFTIHWMIVLTVVHLVVAFTPLFDLLIISGMGVEAEIAEWARLGMQIMIFWSAAIAWRRFLQGVLIKFDRTRTVAIGTAIRLFSGAIVLFLLATQTELPGVAIGAFTWMTGVVSEALYATYVVRPLFSDQLAGDKKSSAAPLRYRALFWFHFPLAATAFLTLLVQPMATFSLARLAEPRLSLAAWPVLFQILLIARAPALALPETIIALNTSRTRTVALRRFTLLLTAIVLVGTLLYTLTRVESFYLDVVQQVPPGVGNLVRFGMTLSLIFPAINVLIFGLRGFLISEGKTPTINRGMIINLLFTALLLLLGVWQSWQGILTAVLALNLAIVAELAFLGLQLRRSEQALRLAAVRREP